MGKKLGWIILLLVVIGAIVIGVIMARKTDGPLSATNIDSSFGKASTTEDITEEKEVAIEEKDNEEIIESNYEKTKVSDGTLYLLDGKEVKTDMVIDEKFYDTTISDIWLNPDNYMNKNIEIEGMYLENSPYTFVGRYSTSNLCPNCPAGYSYFEYQLQGDIDYKFKDEKDWIKVIGILEKGNDETTNYTDYYFLKVLSLEIMNKKGNDTVNN